MKQNILALSYKVIKDFYTKEGLERAHSLANIILLSFVPFLVTIASLTTFLLPQDTYFKLEEFILKSNLPFMGDKISKYMQLFHQHAGSLSLLSFLSFFVTSVLMISNLNHHLTMIYGEDKKHDVSIIVSIINYGTVALGVLLLSAGIMLSYYLALKINLDNSVIFYFITLILSILAFTLVYKFIPSGEVKFNQALVAGTIAAILFELAKRFFVVYIQYFATENVIYGTLAVIPLFLLWIYISCLILLGCASLIALMRNNLNLDNHPIFKENLL
ncbi:MAG: hypothetical protein K0R14_2189 [Burkholderiales bacterium]|jgi:membrane protein|nr:hypothetical protein [Burkholderiales bacterium]